MLKESTEALTDNSKEVGLEANTENCVYAHVSSSERTSLRQLTDLLKMWEISNILCYYVVTEFPLAA
jgi:hypothetical protein